MLSLAIESRDHTKAEHYTWGAGCDGWYLLKHSELAVIRERVPPGAAETWHLHARARQFFFVITGVATLEFNGRCISFGPSQGVHVPPGVAHRFTNAGNDDVEFLVISSPTTIDDRVTI